MSKKPTRYISYCYCATCKKEFILSGNNKKHCLYCKGKDNFVVLSEKKETMGEIDEALKKIISLLKKATQKDYLAGDFEKSEKEELEKLKCLKEAEDFFKKNPNPKKEELDKIFTKVSQIIKN